jgi:hypothetical protein
MHARMMRASCCHEYASNCCQKKTVMRLAAAKIRSSLDLDEPAAMPMHDAIDGHSGPHAKLASEHAS